MGDVGPHLSREELAELAALADGSLPSERRAEVEARIADSPELAELVARQRRALGAVRPMAEEPVPSSLRERVGELRPTAPGSSAGRGLVPRLALSAGAAVVVAVVAVVITLGGGGATAPTVADAAQLATKPATGPPPGRAPGNAGALAASVDGVDFPDLRRPDGWTPAGVRRGTLDGRDVLVVFYAKESRRLAYAVVAGDALGGGTASYASSRYRGVDFRTFTVDGRPAVTWLRNGHTCVLTGDASRSELLALATRAPTRASY
jgi:anti-sigma factor RsiW